MSSINIISQNVRGLGDYQKRRKLFNWFHNKSENVFLLQESHSCKEKESIWKTEWGGDIFFSHGSGAARGVCIMFKNNVSKTIHNVLADDNGRYVIIDIEIDGVRLTLANIYGPNDDNPDFYIKLIELIESLPNDNRLIGGDFNLVLDIDKDKKGGNLTTNKKARNIVKAWMEETDLVDIWRIQHETENKYTWCRKKPTRIFCRLDFFLVSFGMTERVNKSNISYGLDSDHSCITLDLSFCKTKRGRGFWKLNCSHLVDKTYVDKIKLCIKTTIQNNEGTDAILLWDTIKCKIRGDTIKYSSEKKRNNADKLKELEKTLERLNNTTDENEEEREEIKQKIEKEMERKTKGAIIRSRARWFEEGEKNTNYFFNLEKRQANSKTINRLKLEDNSITDDINIILEKQKEFYENLYKESDLANNDELINSIGDHPKLTTDEKNKINNIITEKEILNALKASPNNKSPGEDGLPSEFYKVFWNDIKIHLVSCYKLAFEMGKLGISQRRGIICLIPKKDKDPIILKNWRPISLLNQDYKLLAKSIAERIKSCLKNIIHNDQTGFLKGRYIGENIVKICDIINYCEEEDIPALLITIDFEKAFDLLNWKFIDKSLLFFDFPESIRTWVKILYKDINSCVSNNGWASQFFPLTRGVRQGCPLSPYLFLIAAEILSIYIRQNKNIKGIKIGNDSYKISQYADDTVITIPFCGETLKEIEKTFEKFTQISGLKINYDKTEILRIGSIRNSDAKFITQKQLKWKNNDIKVLGITITSCMNNITKVNIEPLIDKMKAIIQAWSWRKLTIFGRITVINSLLASQLIYRLSVLPSPTLVDLKAIDKILFDYLWGNKPHQIKKQTIIGQYDNGGIKMVDISLKDASLKIAWIKRLLQENNKSIGINLNSYLKMESNLLFKCNLSTKDLVNCFAKEPPQFWKDVLVHWCNLNYENVNDITNPITQIIWLNSNIKINKKPILNKTLLRKNILILGDLVHPNNRFYSFEEFINKYQVHITFTEYYGILNAIPAKWKLDLSIEHQNKVMHRSMIDNILKEDKVSRFAYNEMITRKALFPINGYTKWCEVLNLNLTKEDYLILIGTLYQATNSTKLRSFQYRLMNYSIITNCQRFKWKKRDDALCTFCQLEDENLYHLLLNCNVSKNIWNVVQENICERTGIRIQFSHQQILLGITDFEYNEMYNHIFTIVKQYLYATRCMNVKPNAIAIVKKIDNDIETEKIIAYKNNTVRKFEKKWSPIL